MMRTFQNSRRVVGASEMPLEEAVVALVAEQRNRKVSFKNLHLKPHAFGTKTTEISTLTQQPKSR